MPQNEGYFNKYNVTRVDGKPVGRTFTIEVDRDPFAVAALAAYRNAADDAGGLGQLVTGLDGLLGEITAASGGN